MTSSGVIIETLSAVNDEILPDKNELTESQASYDGQSSSPRISRASSCSSASSSSRPNNNDLVNEKQSNSIHHKETTLKLPYPVLSDRRNPSSILVLLQKETQATSKKLSDVTKKIEECEKRLMINSYANNDKKMFKYERVKLKQQLDALKKHERRVSLQIDFITTKTEINGLEDEKKQLKTNSNSEEYQQINILSGKLKQKLDKMKIYMRTRNEQMKRIINSKQNLTKSASKDRKLSVSSSQKSHSSSAKDSNQKRSSTFHNNHCQNKRTKLSMPVVRLASRITSHEVKAPATPPPVVRFINKRTDERTTTVNSVSPTTPPSSSSTSPPPLIIARTLDSTESPHLRDENGTSVIDDDGENELNIEFDMEELFNDESYSESAIHR